MAFPHRLEYGLSAAPFTEAWTIIQTLRYSLFVLLEFHFRANRPWTRDTCSQERD